MNERPPQPPEGRLLAAALQASGLSIREASRRAGISYGRWRQIVSGYQNVSPGVTAAVRAPAGTLAKMAAAIGVTAEQMEAEGARPDAAEAMRTAPRLAPVPAAPVPSGGDGADPAEQVLADLLERYPADSVLQTIIKVQKHKSAKVRVAEALEWLEISTGTTRGNGTDG